MEYATLGGSDLDVSAVTMGLWNVAGGVTWGETARREAIAAGDERAVRWYHDSRKTAIQLL